MLPPPGDLPRVLAGDFNATLDHAVFRDVLRLGYADAALQVGQALTPTWGPPGRRAVLTLDHVLVTATARCSASPCTSYRAPTTARSSRRFSSPSGNRSFVSRLPRRRFAETGHINPSAALREGGAC